jgi:hypothetical protein
MVHCVALSLPRSARGCIGVRRPPHWPPAGGTGAGSTLDLQPLDTRRQDHPDPSSRCESYAHGGRGEKRRPPRVRERIIAECKKSEWEGGTTYCFSADPPTIDHGGFKRAHRADNAPPGAEQDVTGPARPFSPSWRPHRTPVPARRIGQRRRCRSIRSSNRRAAGPEHRGHRDGAADSRGSRLHHLFDLQSAYGRYSCWWVHMRSPCQDMPRSAYGCYGPLGSRFGSSRNFGTPSAFGDNRVSSGKASTPVDRFPPSISAPTEKFSFCRRIVYIDIVASARRLHLRRTARLCPQRSGQPVRWRQSKDSDARTLFVRSRSQRSETVALARPVSHDAISARPARTDLGAFFGRTLGMV